MKEANTFDIMEKHTIECFIRQMREDEKAEATIEKYTRDVKHFIEFMRTRSFSKESCNEYKEKLCMEYKPTSVNSMISAINRFLEFAGFHQMKLKKLKLQRRIFCTGAQELTKSEYRRLVNAARGRGNERMAFVLETICATGIRVSELEFITVESLKYNRAVIHSKGKLREILLPETLSKRLMAYCKRENIENGSIFVTKKGNPLNRSNIWKDMKALCKTADVDSSKVFPHNLRHLFARTYYSMEKDLNRLADLLGHSSVETTRIYTMTTSRNERKKIERLGLVLNKT